MNELCSKCRKRPRAYQASTRTGSYCKQCHSEYQTEYSKRTGYKVRKSRRDATRQVVVRGKQKPCADCGNEYQHYVMDYDHVRGTKDFNLAEAAQLGVSLKRIVAEIEKCDVVCSNCHRERTFSTKQP